MRLFSIRWLVQGTVTDFANFFFSFFLSFCWLVLSSGLGLLCEHLCISTDTLTSEVA